MNSEDGELALKVARNALREVGEDEGAVWLTYLPDGRWTLEIDVTYPAYRAASLGVASVRRTDPGPCWVHVAARRWRDCSGVTADEALQGVNSCEGT